jgi:hypothetical protein
MRAKLKNTPNQSLAIAAKAVCAAEVGRLRRKAHKHRQLRNNLAVGLVFVGEQQYRCVVNNY